METLLRLYVGLGDLSAGMLVVITAGALIVVLGAAGLALPGIYPEGRLIVSSRGTNIHASSPLE